MKHAHSRSLRALAQFLLGGVVALTACTPAAPAESAGAGAGVGGSNQTGTGGREATAGAGANGGGSGGASGGSGVGGGGAGAGRGGSMAGASGGGQGGVASGGGASGGGTGGGAGSDAAAISDVGTGSGGSHQPPGSGPCTPGGSGFDTATTGIALDRKTCLAWERGDPDRDVSKCPLNIRDNNSKLCWDEAVKYCTALRLDTKTDWRLPTIAELQTLVVAANAPAFDTMAFPQAVLSIYWSSEKKGEKIVAIDFSNRGMLNDHIGPDGPQAFRCVRAVGGN